MKKIQTTVADHLQSREFNFNFNSERSVFDFGTVQIQTAAEKTMFEFEDVPHPAQVTKLINELMLEEEREKIEGRVS